MAKKESGLKDTLSLAPKVALTKSNGVDIEKTENAVKKIHTIPPVSEGKRVRISTDLPEDVYLKFKKKLLEGDRVRTGVDVVRDLIIKFINE